MKEKKYFKVTAKCGHVGRNNYIEKVFPVEAENGKEAAFIVRYMGRVKHDHKDAIRNVVKVSKEEYDNLCYWHSIDPYFQCSSKQEQNNLCEGIEYKIKKEEKKAICDKESRMERIKYILKKQKNLNKFYENLEKDMF